MELEFYQKKHFYFSEVPNYFVRSHLKLSYQKYVESALNLLMVKDHELIIHR